MKQENHVTTLGFNINNFGVTGKTPKTQVAENGHRKQEAAETGSWRLDLPLRQTDGYNINVIH